MIHPGGAAKTTKSKATPGEKGRIQTSGAEPHHLYVFEYDLLSEDVLANLQWPTDLTRCPPALIILDPPSPLTQPQMQTLYRTFCEKPFANLPGGIEYGSAVWLYFPLTEDPTMDDCVRTFFTAEKAYKEQVLYL